jgi:acyl carrier protein
MINKSTIQEQVVQLLHEELVFTDDVDFDASIDSLGIDSIQLMQLFVYLEERFEFEFKEDAMIARIRESTLRHFIDYVHEAIQQSRSSAPPTP